MKKVSINTPGYHYDILIGRSVIQMLPELIKEFSPYPIVFIISRKVEKIHREYLSGIIQSIKKSVIFIVDDSESNKSFRYAEKYFNYFAEKGINRKSTIVGIGGGVIGDFSGFLASLYMRGLPVIHVPTTLLSMVDSSIGGKSAVNIDKGKNMVGAFHHPKLVISDISFLDTLPVKEWKNGLTEVLKHGLIGESRTLGILENNDLQSIQSDKTIIELIYKSAQFKASIVKKDDRETGLRAILNFGHTVGHAMESCMKYKGITHGEAVAVGIKAALNISNRRKWLKKTELDWVNALIEKYRLVDKKYSLDPEKIMNHMKYDKKNFGQKINFVLLKGIGRPQYNCPIDENIIREAIQTI